MTTQSRRNPRRKSLWVKGFRPCFEGASGLQMPLEDDAPDGASKSPPCRVRRTA
jgi:hypothetical protein